MLYTRNKLKLEGKITNKQGFHVLSFVFMHNKQKWKSRSLLSIVLMLIFLFSFVQVQEAQNNEYIFVISYNQISTNSLDKVKHLEGIEYTVSIEEIQHNDTVLYTASKEISRLSRRYIIQGGIASNSKEVNIFSSSKKKINVGETVYFRNKKYHVVGILQDDWFPFIPHSNSNLKTYMLTVSDRVTDNVKYLIICVNIFENSTALTEKLKLILGNNTFIIPKVEDSFTIEFTKISILSSIAVSIAITFLFIMEERKDSALLLAIGWPEEFTLKMIYAEFLIMLSTGFVLMLFILGLYLNYVLRYYLFINLQVTGIIVLAGGINAILVYFFSKLFIFRRENIVEVITE